MGERITAMRRSGQIPCYVKTKGKNESGSPLFFIAPIYLASTFNNIGNKYWAFINSRKREEQERNKEPAIIIILFCLL